MRDKEFEKIYKLYYKDLYLYALSLCQNHYWAEDIVSDTFYKAFITIDNNDLNIKYWLLRVCKNLFIDTFRKNKKKYKYILNIDELILESNNVVLDNLIKNEDLKNLYTCISKLEFPYKDATLMFYFMNMSTKEISIVINTSDGATRNILYKARKKLFKLINVEEVYDEL